MAKRNITIYSDSDLIEQAKVAKINLSQSFTEFLKTILLLEQPIIDTNMNTKQLETELRQAELEQMESITKLNALKAKLKLEQAKIVKEKQTILRETRL